MTQADGDNAPDTVWARVCHGLRVNLVPGLVLQVVAGSVVTLYYQHPGFRVLCDHIGAAKVAGGWWFALCSTAIFGGLVPWCYLALSGRIPRGRRTAHLVFLVLFFAWKGAEVDALYRLQAWWFGEGNAPGTVALKVVVDQFGYNPLWAAPTMALCYGWKDHGFRLRAWGAAWRGLPLVILSILVSAWMVWIPAVSIIYSLPLALQVPLFNLVLCFFSLVAAIAADHRPLPLTAAEPVGGEVVVPDSP